jgi:Protein of unknown function (DUF3489)
MEVIEIRVTSGTVAGEVEPVRQLRRKKLFRHMEDLGDFRRGTIAIRCQLMPNGRNYGGGNRRYNRSPLHHALRGFTIDEQNNITAFGSAEEATATNATPFDSFSSQKELAALVAGWPAERLVAIWNSLPGVTPAKKFKDRTTATCRIWERVQGLGEAAKPKEERKAKVAHRPPRARPRKPGRPRRPPPPRKSPRPRRPRKRRKPPGRAKAARPRKWFAMLQRKNGATLAEIMDKMGWQKHTVRGFMAGSMKKAGYNVESFKPEGGERTYRITK